MIIIQNHGQTCLTLVWQSERIKKLMIYFFSPGLIFDFCLQEVFESKFFNQIENIVDPDSRMNKNGSRMKKFRASLIFITLMRWQNIGNPKKSSTGAIAYFGGRPEITSTFLNGLLKIRPIRSVTQ